MSAKKSGAGSAEKVRLLEDHERSKNWKRWGPYLAERQWGTVREDYSEGGDAWTYFSQDQATSRAYRWGEDGLLGISDRQCRLCFSLALWNKKDPILKERLFGLSGPQGNHGEDCKELYYYLDSTPTHSYMKALYKYPQSEFPYTQLLEENKKRGLNDAEYELLDTGVFNDKRYFDVYAEYAKDSPDDLLIKITIKNRAAEAAELFCIPQLLFRNTWSWGDAHEGLLSQKPTLKKTSDGVIRAEHESLESFDYVYGPASDGTEAELLFTENETNHAKVFNQDNGSAYVKDGFHEYLIHGKAAAVNPDFQGTKSGVLYKLSIPAGGSVELKLRLYASELKHKDPLGSAYDKTFQSRLKEADEFYETILGAKLDDEERLVQRQAYAGLLWTKQFFHYSVKHWLDGDNGELADNQNRRNVRNHEWEHLFNRDVISMPDKWEYPWYAAWDLAFHMVPFCKIDPEFSKEQLILFLREWYMHPNGQIPAYEWNFSDVNPPVHAWACWRIYKISAKKGDRDLGFLKKTFQKLLINFTWWVNRKDPDGNNLFAGGFLGLDNIGVFDRSKPLPSGGTLSQADGTAWMAFYCNTMLSMALELAAHDEAYEDIASKFFEHFVGIVNAMNKYGGCGLWDDEDGFYYDQLRINDHNIPLKVRSMVGLIPLFAVEILPTDTLDKLPGFQKRMNWFLKNAGKEKSISFYECEDRKTGMHLLSIPNPDKLKRVLAYLLDENEFLSPFGIRSLSKYHKDNPYIFSDNGEEHRVDYAPGESDTWLFGGNSNWRGPIWFPVNYLIIESLLKYHHFFGDDFKVECPTGSGNMKNLQEVADIISKRISGLFLKDEEGKIPAHGNDDIYRDDPDFNELILFYEYFHADNGRGCGASHQTGWTALVAKTLDKLCWSR